MATPEAAVDIVAPLSEAVRRPTALEKLSLGPKVDEFVRTCVEANAPLFTAAWVSAGVVVCLTVCVAVRHYREISRAPICVQRLYYHRATWFAPVLGVTACVSLFTPRVYPMSLMLQNQFEAIALNVFSSILFLLVAHESCQCFADGPLAKEPLAEKILLALQEQGEKKHFGVPPVGCCWTTCMKPFNLRAWHLILIRYLVNQYAFVVVGVALVGAWSVLALELEPYERIHRVLHYADKVSAFAAIYGLMIMYKSTHELLHKWRTTAKFVSIKLVIFLGAFQELLIGWFVEHVPPASKDCLTTAGESVEQQMKHRENFWSMYLLSIESLLVAVLCRRAFPAQEIQDFGDHALELVDMELERLWSRDLSKAVDSEESEEETDRDPEDGFGQVSRND